MSKYISLDNLSRYDSKMQAYASANLAPHGLANWNQTEKASSVSFWPVGNSPLEGTVDFRFTETPPASGTKSPDNPSTITGVTSVGLTVCQSAGVDEHEYSINLGGTYYGGSIDLATGLMTVTWKSSVISSFSNFADDYTNSANFNAYTPSKHEGNVSYLSAFLACNKFQPLYGNSDVEHCRFIGNTGVGNQGIRFYINKSRLDLSNAANPSSPTNTEWLDAANAWVANNPIFISYKLFTPETLQLSAPQLRALLQPDKYIPRINTVYSDAENVQIVYQKNPVRDKFEKVQAIIAQGGNV